MIDGSSEERSVTFGLIDALYGGVQELAVPLRVRHKDEQKLESGFDDEPKLR